jgi:PAS domain S-box-containing protein
MRTNPSKAKTEKAAVVHPGKSSSKSDAGRVGEAQYRGIVELLPHAVWVTDHRGAVIYCNKHWREFSGLTLAQTVESGWFSILHPEDRPRALAQWRQAIATKTYHHHEYRFRRARDGEYRWHLIQGFPSQDASGSVVHSVGIAVDVHAHKANELALREKDDQLRLAIEAARLGTWDYSLERRTFSTSYRSNAMLGFAPGIELTYENFVAILHPDDRRILREAFVRATSPEGLSEFELHYRIIRPDGAVRWIAARGKGIFSGAGSKRKAVSVTGTVQDITEKKQAEQALHASEEKFRRAFRSNPDAMSITTLDEGVYLDVNDAFLRLSGYTREELVGRSSLNVRIWIEAENRARMMQALIENGRLDSVESCFRKKTGEVLYMRFSAEVIEIGDIQCVLATSQDITEQRRAAEELRRSEEQYRSLIEHAPYGICRITAQGRFLLVNPALARMLGYETPSELLDLDLATHVYEKPEARDALISSLAQDPSKQPPIEARWKRRDGQTIIVRLVGTAICDGQGRLLHSEVFVERVAGQ